jgi:hypothetical protein
MAKAIADRGWTKYLLLIKERLSQSARPMDRASLYFAECLLAACDKGTKRGEIAHALKVASEQWPAFQENAGDDMRRTLSVVHEHGGKYPVERPRQSITRSDNKPQTVAISKPPNHRFKPGPCPGCGRQKAHVTTTLKSYRWLECRACKRTWKVTRSPV